MCSDVLGSKVLTLRQKDDLYPAPLRSLWGVSTRGFWRLEEPAAELLSTIRALLRGNSCWMTEWQTQDDEAKAQLVKLQVQHEGIPRPAGRVGSRCH